MGHSVNTKVYNAVTGKIDVVEYVISESEIAAMQAEQRKTDLYERTRPLTESEVSRMFIAKNINAVITDDATASRAVEFHPTLKQDGSLIPAGTRINWNGTIKRAAVDLRDTEENNPERAPALWEDIRYVNGCRVIPEVITAGLAFAEGEYGWWKDAVYESLQDGNVWNPDQFPAGWKQC